jgi:uncharacterized protein YjiS (DUF1127 family)
MAVVQFEVARISPSQGRRGRSRSALRDTVGSMFETLSEWRRRARGRAELAALDDRMLRDIGLSPADAEFLANKPFWRE